jgi:hypothetical protein
VRTTIDLPDELFRQVKARAAGQGMKLKEYIARALLDSLYRHDPVSEVRETATRYGEDALVLRDDCVLPQIRGKTSRQLRSLTEERIDQLLDEEEVADAVRAGRRQRLVGDARGRAPAP